MMLTQSVESIDKTMAHTYILTLGGKRILIDAGGKASGDRIARLFRARGKGPDVILVTHYHPDHIGGLAQLKREFNPEIYAPAEELQVISGEAKPKPADSFISRFVTRMAKVNGVKDVKSVESLDIPGLEVIRTHGHTPGSTSYLVRKDNAIFVGDAVHEKNGMLEISRAFTMDFGEAERSRKTIMEFRGVTVYPGHGNPVMIGQQ